MQEGKEYFKLDQCQTFKGQCQQFIAPSQKQWRSVDKLEQSPYQRVSVYTRNVQYKPENTRTFETLKKVLAYLIQKIFPLIFQPNRTFLERQRVALFLQQRLIAIRCQYFVQGIICPSEILKILRCFIVVWIIKGKSNSNFELIGLQFLVQDESKQIMERQFTEEYYEALIFSIISSKKAQLLKLLSIHQIILENNQLTRLLALRLKLQTNNFEAYYQGLSQQSPTIRCLLWLKIQQVKVNFIKIVKKSYGDVPTKWLHQCLCLQNHKKQEKWINSKQIKAESQAKQIGFQAWIDFTTLRKVVY